MIHISCLSSVPRGAPGEERLKFVPLCFNFIMFVAAAVRSIHPFGLFSSCLHFIIMFSYALLLFYMYLHCVSLCDFPEFLCVGAVAPSTNGWAARQYISRSWLSGCLLATIETYQGTVLVLSYSIFRILSLIKTVIQ